MSLGFPNSCRSYDATRRAVRFWGHEGAMEATFFIDENALRRLQPDLRNDEAGLLGAFDSNLALIRQKAITAYGRGRKGSYDLSAADFV